MKWVGHVALVWGKRNKEVELQGVERTNLVQALVADSCQKDNKLYRAIKFWEFFDNSATISFLNVTLFNIVGELGS